MEICKKLRGEPKLLYALKNDKIVSILEIPENERGEKCDCICPLCKARLQARLGYGVKQPHFAHGQTGCNIIHAQQTALHMLAKEIIQKEKKIKFPNLEITYKETDLYSKYPQYQFPAYGGKEFLPIEFDRVDLEQRVGSFVPDIVVEKGNVKCFIEIAVTHFIDEEKRRKIQQEGISTLEIDLSDCKYLDRETLEDILINQTDSKKWIYHRHWKKTKEEAEKTFMENIEIELKYGKETKLSKGKSEENFEKRNQNEQMLYDAVLPNLDVIRSLKNDEEVRILYKTMHFYCETIPVPFYMDIPIYGEWLFNCDRRIWQMRLFDKFIYSSNCEFINIGDCGLNRDLELDSHVKCTDGRFHLTEKLLIKCVEHYLNFLQKLGFVKYDFHSKKWNVLFSNRIDSPNEIYADKLRQVLQNVNVGNTDVDKQIYDYIQSLSI